MQPAVWPRSSKTMAGALMPLAKKWVDSTSCWCSPSLKQSTRVYSETEVSATQRDRWIPRILDHINWEPGLLYIYMRIYTYVYIIIYIHIRTGIYIYIHIKLYKYINYICYIYYTYIQIFKYDQLIIQGIQGADSRQSPVDYNPVRFWPDTGRPNGELPSHNSNLGRIVGNQLR